MTAYKAIDRAAEATVVLFEWPQWVGGPPRPCVEAKESIMASLVALAEFIGAAGKVFDQPYDEWDWKLLDDAQAALRRVRDGQP